MKRKNTFKYAKIFILFFVMSILVFTNAKASSSNEELDSTEEWRQEDYWEWHTRTTTDDKAYNGKHIQIQNDKIDFFGYWNNSYKDFLYKDYDKTGKKIFEFVIDDQNANYHTLDGAGFIFNAKKENNKLSCYILLFTESDVNIYKLENVDIETFETTSSKIVADYGKLIKSAQKTSATTHNLRVEITPINVTVIDNGNELFNLDLDYSSHEGESFGLISSYVQHSCEILSKIEFYQLKVTLENYGLKVINTDTENKIISGGVFQIKDENGEIISEKTTNKNGMIYIDGLKEGNYTIQQKKAPDGYSLNSNIYRFEIDSDGKAIITDTGKSEDLTIKNEKIKEVVNDNKTDENIQQPSNNIKKDDTISNKIIPNAGNKVAKAIVLTTVFGIAIVFLIVKLKEYEDVK